MAKDKEIKIPKEKELTADSLPNAEIEKMNDYSALYKQIAKGLPMMFSNNLETFINEIDDMLATDSHISATFNKLAFKVLQKDWEVLPATKESADMEIASFIRSVFYEDIQNLEKSFECLLEAIKIGFSISYIAYGQKDGKWTINKLKHQDPRYWRLGYKDEEIFYSEEKKFKAGSMTQIHPFKVVIHRNRTRYSNPYGESIFGKKTWWLYKFKKEVTKYWLRWIEKYTHPTPFGKHPEDWSKQIKEEFLLAISKFSTDKAITLPDTAELGFLQASDKLSDVFSKFMNYANQEISKDILGETLTMQQQEAAGSYSLGEVHRKESDVVVNYHALNLQCTINEQIIKPLVQINFPNAIKYPYFQFSLFDRNISVLTDMVSKLYATGFAFSRNQLYEIFNLQKPESDDDILQKIDEAQGGKDEK